MNATHLLFAVAIGIGATLLIDLWAVFLKRAFDILSSLVLLVLTGIGLVFAPAGST